MSCSFEVCGDKATRNPKDSTVGATKGVVKDSTVGTSGVGTPEALPVKDSTVGISEGVSVAAITFIKNERIIIFIFDIINLFINYIDLFTAHKYLFLRK